MAFDWKGLIKHPVVHFLAIGVLLFVVDAWRHAGREAPQSVQILVDQPRLEALAGIWRAQFGRPPTEIELVTVARAWADEEMRVREAKRLGLDRDDSVIRRRLAQKYDFLTGDTAAVPVPADAVLKRYLADHLDRYGAPTRYSFDQVLFSADRGRERALAAADAALRSPDRARGDDFPASPLDRRATLQEVRQDFGSNFAEALPKLTPGVWQGPVESGFGFHLVRVTERAAPTAPDLETVRSQVLADWLSEKAAAASATAAAKLKSQYKVSIDPWAVRAVVSGGAAK